MLPALVWALAQVLAAYLFVDFCTGLYHYATDRGWNHPTQVAMFQDHHNTNTMTGFDWQPMLVGLPIMAVGLWLGSSFLLAGGAFGILAQVPHYYAHRRSESFAVHRVVRWLQLHGLIISPEHHAAHHRGKFDCNFCILSGWCNPVLNLFVRAA
jgi:hypothetical protein